MFPLISTCAENLEEYLKNNAKSERAIETKEAAGKYATDVITTCVFGIENKCLLNPNAEFREFGKKSVEFSVYRSFEFMSIFMLPLVKVMNVKFFSNETTKFLRKAFWDSIKEREEKKIKREDFIDLLIQLKNEDKPNSKKENGTKGNETVEEKTAFGKWISYLVS
jgi:cytochrome P450 family 6